MNTDTTFQKTFIDNISPIIFDAYNCGVLQCYPLTIANITVTMTMFRNFNQLLFQFNNRALSISMYDEDSEETQFASINNLLMDIIGMKKSE